MTSPYQEFLEKVRERFRRNQEKERIGVFVLTRHAKFKMRQYGLSEQRVRGVIRNPRRREEGIVKDTVAVMQPISPKRDATGAEIWKQEIWVMFQQKIKHQKSKIKIDNFIFQRQIRIISAWRYPGVSPKRNPIPEKILQEIEEGSILEEESLMN